MKDKFFKYFEIGKPDKGLFRIWIVISIIWIIGSLYWLWTKDNFIFHEAYEKVNNITYTFVHTPFHAFAYVLLICFLPPFLILIAWAVIKWISKGCKE